MEKALITFKNSDDDSYSVFGINWNNELTIREVDCEFAILEYSRNIIISDVDDFIDKLIKLRDMVNEKRN